MTAAPPHLECSWRTSPAASRPALHVEALEARDVPATLFVNPAGPTDLTHFTTVQAGIDAAVGFHYNIDVNGVYTAVPGDTVRIAAGAYPEEVTLNKAITLRTFGTVSVEDLTVALPQHNSASLINTLHVLDDVTINTGQIHTGLYGGTLAIQGDVTSHDPTFQGTTTYLLNGPGNQALTGVYTGGVGPARVGGVTIDKPSGLLTIAGNLTTVGNWYHKAGAVNAAGSEVVIGGNQWGTQTVRTSGMSFDNLRIEGGSYQKVNALSNLDVDGGFFLYSTGNDGPLVFKAPAVLSIGGDFGTTAVKAAFHPNFVAGTGKVVFTASTPDGATPQVIAPTKVEFNDVEFALSAYRSVTVVNPWTPTGDAPVRVNGDLTIANGVSSGIEGGVIAVRGNVYTANDGLHGSATLLLDGAGDQSVQSSYSVVGALPSVVINKPGGTVRIPNANPISVRGSWTNIGGDFDAGFGTIRFDGRDPTITSRGEAFYSVDLPGVAYSTLTVKDGDPLVVSKNLTLGGSFDGRIEVRGNVTTSNQSGSRTGTIAFVGDNYQNLTSAVAGGQVTGIEIAKGAGGRLTVSGGIVALGDWTYVSGHVLATNSTVTFAMATGGTQTVTSGTMKFGNVVVAGGGYDSTLKLVGELTALGDVTLAGDPSSGLDTLSDDLVCHGTLTTPNTTFGNADKVSEV